jgi:copper chaperone
MQSTVLRVEGMSCEHCVKAVTKAAGALPGVANVTVDLKGKLVVVEHDAAKSPVDAIKAAVEDQGYDVVG